jgi:hypothetical protein
MPYDAHRGSYDITPLILNFSAGWAWVVNAPPREEATGHIMSWDAPTVRSRQAWRTEYFLHPPVFDPRIVQLAASGLEFKVT